MSSTQERFKQIMENRKKQMQKNEIIEKSIKKNKDNIVVDTSKIFQFNYEVFQDFPVEKETLDFLKNKSVEILQIQGKNMILLGKNLTEVFEELGKKGSPDGLYYKFLEVNGFKKDTALRLRKRYELYSNIEESNLKEIIAILPVKKIEKLYREQYKFLPILKEKKHSLSYDEVINLIEDDIVETKESDIIEIKENYNSQKISNLYRKLETSFETLDTGKKEKIEKLLNKIEKILEI